MIDSCPKQLFLIDAAGALFSAFLLGVVLVRLESVFGIPAGALYFLAVIPLVFVAYDLCCYFGIKRNIGKYLKIIAYSNLAYCVVSIATMMYHFSSLTSLGIGYILLEVIIIVVLVVTELKVAQNLIKKETYSR